MARKRTHRRAAHATMRATKSRHHAVKHQADKHVGRKLKIRIVNAPKAW